MVQVTLTDADFAGVTGKDLDELYSNLAVAESGTQANVGAALESVGQVRAMIAAPPTAGLVDDLVGIGKNVFNRVWPTVKAIVCKTYGENSDSGSPLKNRVEAAASAIAAALGIAGAVAALIIAIAIKLELDKICAVSAPAQPA